MTEPVFGFLISSSAHQRAVAQTAQMKGEQMTTPAAAALYEAQHVYQYEGRACAVFNPHSKPVAELPVIYGFNNGGSADWWSACAIAQDGVVLGGHICSSEAYMPHDLGVLEGTREDRHRNDYSKHYPDGYRMEFVRSDDIDSHAALNEAFRLNKLQAQEVAAA